MSPRTSSLLRRGSLIAVVAALLSSLSLAPAVGASGSPPPGPQGTAECTDGTFVDASFATGLPGRHGRHDSDGPKGDEARAADERLAAGARGARLALWKHNAGRVRVTIPVFLHVITQDDGSGAPPEEALDEQLRILNEAFSGEGASAPTIFRFEKKSVEVTRNSDWYIWSAPDDADATAAKAALHRGGRGDLNLYITGSEDLLGHATFPFERPLFRDGVMVFNQTLPGGLQGDYNLGDNLVHEVGHWLGLYHTFENGCESPGDRVADTPYQANDDRIAICDESSDTCPAPGRDPVHNYMNYSSDVCRDRFTVGQSVRMAISWFVFRAGDSRERFG